MKPELTELGYNEVKRGRVWRVTYYGRVATIFLSDGSIYNPHPRYRVCAKCPGCEWTAESHLCSRLVDGWLSAQVTAIAMLEVPVR